MTLATFATLTACRANLLEFQSDGTSGEKETLADGAPAFDGSSAPDAGGDAASATDDGGLTCSTGAAEGQCGCQQTIAGHSYSYSCGAPFVSPGANDAGETGGPDFGTCICTVDGVETVTFQSSCEGNVVMQFTAPRNYPMSGCNFP